MKRILAIFLALMLALSMTVFVHAEDEVAIPLDADHLTGSPDYFASADVLTFGDGTVNADQVEIMAFALPKNVIVGQTVTVHIKGSSDGDFRVWLIAADVTASKGDHATFSNMWKASENGFTSGDFDFSITLTAVDAEPIGGTEANKVCFKAPAAHGILDNLTVTYLSITYPSAEEVEAAEQAAIEEAQPYADAASAALEAANAANGDATALWNAHRDAIAAAHILGELAEKGSVGVKAMLDEAAGIVNQIDAMIKEVESGEVMSELQSYIDTVNNALTTAQAAGSDVAAVETALADAKAAVDHITEVANATGYDAAMASARETRATLKDIESLLEDAKVLKAQEDAQAAADAEKAAAEAEQSRKTTVTVVIVVAVVVVIIAVIAAILGILKKKKK